MVSASSFVALDGFCADPPKVAEQSENSTPTLPAKRWLYSHPSHLRWWVLPNMEKFPEQPRVITGVFCVFVESRSGNDSIRWLSDIRQRCKDLGLDFAYGERHSHQSKDDLQLPKDPRWQQFTIDKIKTYGGDQVIIDMEPYYSGGQRYHQVNDRKGLEEATVAWKNLGPVDLYICPMGPEYVHGLALAENAVKGEARVYGLDERTYNPLNLGNFAKLMSERAALLEAKGIKYVPGLFLYFGNDPKVMAETAKYGECWFYARTGSGHPDDLPHFGMPSWHPTAPEKK